MQAKPHWSAWLARDAALLCAGDGHGATHFLAAFGGMSSLADLVLEPRSLDDRFRSMREMAWILATALVREAENDGRRPE